VPRSGFRQQERGERRKNGGGRVILTGLVLLLLVLAPLLQGLGIEVRHHGTFLACLAFTLIGLAAFGFHPCPSPHCRLASQDHMESLAEWRYQLMLKLIFILLWFYDHLLSRYKVTI
jgi:hypothetical protein